MKKLKAENLHKEMIQFGFKEEELKKPGKNSFRPMKELQSMVEDRLEKNRSGHAKRIEEELAARLLAPPPIFRAVTQPEQEQTENA
jgi:hypothetical protein